MKMQVFDTKTGAQRGTAEVPDDVILAAQKVEHWILAQPRPNGITIHGLKLSQPVED